MDQFGAFAMNQGWSIVTGQSPSTYERVGRNIRIKGFEQNAVVAACIRTVVDLIGPVRIELYRENGKGEKTLLPQNPGQLLLDAPRVQWSAVRTVKTLAAHYVSYGNAYWILERSGPFDSNGVRTGLPTGIRVVHPENILYVYLDRDSLEPIQYDWTDRIGRHHQSPWTDVVHFRDLTLDTQALFGFPRGAAALLDMVTDGEASEFVRQVMGNNGSPALIIGVDGVKTEQQARDADERWHETAVKRGQRGRVRFMPGLQKVEQIGFNLRELEFPDLRQISREDICAAFGVDPRMISVASAKGTEAGLSGQQYQEARRRLYLQTGAPIMLDIESELNLSYCPEFGPVKARFSPDAISDITEDEEQTSVRITREWQAGVISREEARKTRNRPEKLPPTDHIISPRGTVVMTVVDADRVAAADAEAKVNPPTPSAGALPPGAPKPPVAPPDPAAKSRIVKRSVALSPDQRTALWQAFDTRATKEEAQYRRTAVALFSSERDTVRSLCDRAALRSRAGDATDPPPATPEQIELLRRAIEDMYGERSPVYEAWASRYLQLVRETMLSASADLHATAGVEHQENPKLVRAYHARADRLAQYVTETTATQIMGAIEAGHTAGMGIRQIADLIDSSVFEGQAPARSQTIARTESAGALNEGEYVAAHATGVLQSKSWLSQRDGDVRESHVECDSDGFIDLDAAFSNGLRYPGDPDGDAEDVINCRCAQLFSDEAAK